jgi:predicted nucleic-acid-binding Zn-ribbon protein
MESKKNCPKCSGDMEEGFVVDHSYGTRSVSEWSEGPPESSVWSGLKVKEPKAISTFCCIQCGYLESYARKKAHRKEEMGWNPPAEK